MAMIIFIVELYCLILIALINSANSDLKEKYQDRVKVLWIVIFVTYFLLMVTIFLPLLQGK